MGEQLSLLKQTTIDYLMGAARRVYGMRGPRVVNNPDGIWVGDTPATTAKSVPQRQQSMTFVVRLVQLLHDSGTGAIASPFTYTLKDYATGTTLLNADGTDATGLSPVFPRAVQARVVTAATAGGACRDENGDWVLVHCGEVFGKGPCP